MPKQNVQIDIPKEVKGKARQEYLTTARELLKEQTVLRLFEEGKAAAGYAANLLELNRYEFDELLAKHRISPFNCTKEELDKEFEVGGELARKLTPRTKRTQ